MLSRNICSFLGATHFLRKTDLKMNWSSIFLIKFLMIIFFPLKGAMVRSEVHGILGHPVFLPSPFNELPYDVKWTKDKILLVRIREKVPKDLLPGYDTLANGTLKIKNLKEEDGGRNYRMEAYDKEGTLILTRTFLLVARELLHLQLVEKCSTKLLTCEVKRYKLQKPNIVLYYNNKELSNIEGPEYTDGKWKVTYTLTTLSGNFSCEANNSVSKQLIQKEISCPDPTGDMFLYLSIGGSIVVFIVFLAVLIYCIRKKRAKRHELEAEENELRARIAVENGLKHRKLPQPPVRVISNQPPQQHMPPAPHSEVPQQAGPPQPRPRPPHQKPPRRMREKL